jgi:hypothetical protein
MNSVTKILKNIVFFVVCEVILIENLRSANSGPQLSPCLWHRSLVLAYDIKGLKSTCNNCAELKRQAINYTYHIHIFFHSYFSGFQPFSEIGVVSLRDIQEVLASVTQSANLETDENTIYQLSQENETSEKQSYYNLANFRPQLGPFLSHYHINTKSYGQW